jgi:hypothetical protein
MIEEFMTVVATQGEIIAEQDSEILDLSTKIDRLLCK